MVYLSTTLNTGHAYGTGRETIIWPVSNAWPAMSMIGFTGAAWAISRSEGTWSGDVMMLLAVAGGAMLFRSARQMLRCPAVIGSCGERDIPYGDPLRTQ